MAPTFASAAAQNQNQTREGSEWSRRPNGATQTFRRPSGQVSTNASNPQQDSSSQSQPARYVPPHRNGPQSDLRYSKDQLLDLYKAQSNSEGSLRDGLPDLYIGGWQPDISNGVGSSSWGRSDQSRENPQGPDICWDRDGSVEPLGLIEMDDEERELFTSSVNTPLKPPTTAKDNQQSNGLPGGRKISISSQATTPGGYGPLSPTTTRGTGRRRETSESFQFPSNPLSPTEGRFPHGDYQQRATSPPPSLTRRRTETTKDANKPSDRDVVDDDKATGSSFGNSLKRTTTGPLSAGFGSTSSPWSNAPTSAGLSPMGSFGNFGLGQQSSQSDKRPGLGSGRAESRYKNLLNKESEDASTKHAERKTSMSSLSRLNENESWRPQQSQDYDSGPLEESEEDLPVGSAALASSLESQQMQMQGGLRGFGTPGRSETRDEYGFGAFGMTMDNTSGFGQGGFFGSRQIGGLEAMSPTDTNPYQSPEQHAVEHLTEDLEPDMSDLGSAQLPGLGGFGSEQMQGFGGLGGLGALPNLGRPNLQDQLNDRSQTSSASASRGFPGLGGIGPMGVSGAAAWPVSHGGIGTPTRQTSGLPNAFGSGMFGGGLNDLQSPGLAGLGGSSILSPQIGGGGSRMASMFPPAMQDQMRFAEQEQGSERSFPGMGDFGRTEGMRDLQAGQFDQGRSLDQPSAHFGAQSGQLPQSQAPIGQAPHQSQEQPRSQPSSAQPQNHQSHSSASNQPPPPQQRTMVMPDRMRWIYKDPQGVMQGPWSGLEMHDWYKAGFFSPELLVKKQEDLEYEPLAQLIRRIGNSREPFLVPQIGIPHGAPSNNGPTAWASQSGSSGSGAGSATTATGGGGGAQPPFASSFPSFGTTLTAEQQNALERRKQEEQYLMARQKEHLAQAQIAQRLQHTQLHHGGPSHHGSGLMPGQGQLQHHGSAQSLHSQPSFGSMASPTSAAYQPSPSSGPQQGQAPGFFDNSFRSPGQAAGLGAIGAGIENLGQIREEEIPGIMDRLDISNRTGQSQHGAPGQPFASQQQDDRERQVQQMLEDRARLRQEQELQGTQGYAGSEQAIANERLMQFQQLQGKIDSRFQPAMMANEDRAAAATQGAIGSPTAAMQAQPQSPELSLTEQVQKAASVQQSPVQQHPGLPQPFPPAPSQSPLPAPAAQRTGRQSVADQLQTESRDLSETPSAETPSAIAPWAKESVEASRGPSLKEIQELEAKKAAEAEEIASAQRRAAFQKEMEAQAAQVPPAPGLPASASWADGSPLTPTGSGASAWAKAAQKPISSTSTKSMAQIQKEEEARKKKIASASAAAAQATAMSGVANPAGGKSYANLAGKVAGAPNSAAASGGAWTTVGAGGKPKTPAAAAPVPAPVRSASSGIVPTAQTVAAAKKAPVRAATMTAGGVNAQEEFRKWAAGELRPDLSKGISAEEFVANLVALPQDVEMITEAVHGASSTIDSRHFADEFIRRKKLADKGLIDTSAPPKSASPHSGAAVDKSGGWSEVAKKGPTKEVTREESNGNFRVVASKKKGSKR